MKLIVAGILLVFSAGCAVSPKQVVGWEFLEKRAQAAANSKQCWDEVKNAGPLYERLNNLFIFDLQDDRQLSKIIIRSYVTEQNITDLIAFRELVQSCHDRSLADYGSADIRYAEYMLSVRKKGDENLLALLNRQITIGERNVYLLESLLNNRQRFAEIDRQVTSDLLRAHYQNNPKAFGEGYAEEFYGSPAITLPGRPGISSQEGAGALAEAKAAARCRFEGHSIRCD